MSTDANRKSVFENCLKLLMGESTGEERHGSGSQAEETSAEGKTEVETIGLLLGLL